MFRAAETGGRNLCSFICSLSHLPLSIFNQGEHERLITKGMISNLSNWIIDLIKATYGYMYIIGKTILNE